jgi:hypothetical protein
MNPQDKQAIESVFTRLAQVEGTAGPRDGEAEAYIQSKLAAQPGSAYYLAQTVLVQQQALEEAQKKIAALERSTPAQAPAQAQPSSSGGGLFGFGRSSQGSARQNAQPQAAPMSSSGFGRSASGAGGGFLAGAAQTALGVAGGMMLGSLLGGMFGGNDAQAAPAEETPAEEDAAAPEDEAGYDEGGDDFSGDEDF